MRKCGAVFFGLSAGHHEKGYVFGVRDEWLICVRSGLSGHIQSVAADFLS